MVITTKILVPKVDSGTVCYIQVNDNWYYVNAEGKILKGRQTIDRSKSFDTKTGQQIKGGFTDKDGKLVIKRKILSIWYSYEIL